MAELRDPQFGSRSGIANVTIVCRQSLRQDHHSISPGVAIQFSVTDAASERDRPNNLNRGRCPAGNVIGALVDGVAYAYRIGLGDSPALLAANLCMLMQTDRMATAHGSRINLPGATAIVARVVRDNNAFYEGRRQEKDVRAICWCATPAIRDSLSAAIDLSVDQSPFLSLPDGSAARVSYRNTTTSDQSQNALLYRRDLIYCVEYPTVTSVNLPSMLFGAAAINGQITFG